MIRAGRIELAWSYIIDFENAANPFFERKYTIEKWKHLSIIDIEETEAILMNANSFVKQGLKAKDALHMACQLKRRVNIF
jgi:hypothetical protein